MAAKKAAVTLRAWFEESYAPMFLCDAARLTIEEYSQVVSLWERYTSNPPAGAITFATLVAFRDALRLRRGRAGGESLCSPATVNKHLRALNAMLSKLGPSGPRNRDALGVLERTPWVKQLRVPRPRPRAISDMHLAAIYRAAGEAVHPAIVGVSAAAWWQALIVVAYNLGLRRGALLGLRQVDVDFDRAELRVPAAIDKCDEERCKPLNDVCLRHLLRLRRGEAAALLFPWPRSMATLYREWWRLQAIAGVRSAERYQLHALKRTCGTKLAECASPWVVQAMLDHSRLETSRHYVAADLREAVSRMPQPEVFLQGGFDHGSRQTRLFG